MAGEIAPNGVREIAENGNLDPMVAGLESDERVSDVVVAAGDPPPGSSRRVDSLGNHFHQSHKPSFRDFYVDLHK